MTGAFEPGADWSPTAKPEALRRRAQLLERIRSFFASKNVLEVETPVLSSAGNSDPGIRQWRTHDPEAWLRTSPEYAMKRLLAAGSGDIYELGRVFRADESGRHHNREFTLLEWYRVGWTYHQLMDEVEELLRYCWPGQELTSRRIDYRQLFQQFAEIDPLRDDDDRLRARLAAEDVALAGMSRNECLDLLLSVVIQPRLEANTLTFLFDFPPEQAALARIRPGDSPVAERFELFLGSTELANGYQELTDPEEQRRRFENENAARLRSGQAAVPIDERLLAAMRHGLPECAGVALGVDRLLMATTGAGALADILGFDGNRA